MMIDLEPNPECDTCRVYDDHVDDLYVKVEELEDDRDLWQKAHGDLVEKFSRILYITGQLTMLRDKEGEEYKKLHAEYISMKFPEFNNAQGE